MQETNNISAYRTALRERILETAMSAFASQGIKAVKMDDIARQLNISKRTLYELFENKETLLYEGVKKFKIRKERDMQQLSEESPNVMDLLLKSYYLKVDDFKHTCMAFFEDLHKYPRVMTLLQRDMERNRTLLLEFFERGVSEGYFRPDADYNLISQLLDVESQYVMNNRIYKSFSIETIFRSIVFVSLRGVCTQKGIEAFDRMLG